MVYSHSIELKEAENGRELKEAENGRYWLIDGQQRLLSLVAVMRGSVRLKRGSYKSVVLKFNPLNEESQFDSPRVRGNPLWISIKELIEKPVFQIIKKIKGETLLTQMTLQTT